MFWDLLTEIEGPTTIASDVCCKTLKKFLKTIKNKWQGIVFFLHDTARPNTAARVSSLLEEFK